MNPIQINAWAFAKFITYNNTITEDVAESAICGLNDLKEYVRKNIINRADLANRAFLLVGPPGVGKRLIAQWIASETKAYLYNLAITKNDILRYSFKNPSVVLVPKVDSFKDLELLYTLLRLVDRHETLTVIGTAHDENQVNSEILHKFQVVLNVPLPDVIARQQIIESVLSLYSKKMYNISLTAEEIRETAALLENWSCVHIKKLCIEACTKADTIDRSVTKKHILTAICSSSDK